MNWIRLSEVISDDPADDDAVWVNINRYVEMNRGVKSTFLYTGHMRPDGEYYHVEVRETPVEILHIAEETA